MKVTTIKTGGFCFDDVIWLSSSSLLMGIQLYIDFYCPRNCKFKNKVRCSQFSYIYIYIYYERSYSFIWKDFFFFTQVLLTTHTSGLSLNRLSINQRVHVDCLSTES